MSAGFLDRLKLLNKKQQEAVLHIDGPMVIRAGPGTGKTQLLTTRVENILTKTDTAPENILCLTFTDSANETMKQRLFSAIGNPARKVNFYTFHGFGSFIINKLHEYSDESILLNPVDEISSYQIIEKLLDKLKYTNPITTKWQNNYYYINYIRTVFSWLKQSGLGIDSIKQDLAISNKFFKQSESILDITFKNKINKKQFTSYQKLYLSLVGMHNKYPSKSSSICIRELEMAINNSELNANTKPITIWKNKWIEKNHLNKFVFSDKKNQQKFIATLDLLTDYQSYIKEKGLYDYDDMILRAIEAIETNLDLRLSLQEHFQYILVDEYQDTNGAQNKLLYLLAKNPINENHPNLMVVGDSNQAIFSFQGGDSSLIRNFQNDWLDTKVVTLTDSYRSGQKLLDLSKSVIDNANELNNVTKDNINLISKTKNKFTEIEDIHAENQDEAYYQVSLEIKRLIKNGIKPKDIAIISKQHKYLISMLPFLVKTEVPITYEREDRILDQPRIIELIDLAELVYAISNNQNKNIDQLLAKVLAAGYFNLSAESWWEMAIKAKSKKNDWIDIVRLSKNVFLRNFWKSLTILAKKSKNQPFELIFSQLIGRKSVQLENGKSFNIPWLSYYFNEETTPDYSLEYLTFIQQFNKLQRFFKSWSLNSDNKIKLEDFITFIKAIDRPYVTLEDKTTYKSSENSVTLTTAYKAKGEEWDYVFVLDCHNQVWAKTAKYGQAQFKLPSAYNFIEPAMYSKEDIVKPFYVAITRAVSKLYLVSYLKDSSGKILEYLDWLDARAKSLNLKKSSNYSSIVKFETSDWQEELLNKSFDYKIALQPIISDYKLSPTDLNHYLNIEHQGTKTFIFQKLLKLPAKLNISAIYGTLIHGSIHYFYQRLQKTSKVITEKELLNYFHQQMTISEFDEDEFSHYSQRGNQELRFWYNNNKSNYSVYDISEYRPPSTYLSLGNAKITGQIDLIRWDNDQAKIVDFKTSKVKTKYGKIDTSNPRVYAQQRQLIFYKIILDLAKTEINSNRLDIKSGSIEYISPSENGTLTSLNVDFEDKDIERLKKLIVAVYNKIIKLDFVDTSKYKNTKAEIIKFEDDLINNRI